MTTAYPAITPGFLGSFTEAQKATLNPAKYPLQTIFVLNLTGVAPFGYFATSDGSSWNTVINATPPVQVGVSRDLTNADNGLTLECTATVTLNYPAGLTPGFSCSVIPSGTTSVSCSGGATLNGAGATLTRAAASNTVFAILARGSNVNNAVVTGS